jgi:hypothetical protein
MSYFPADPYPGAHRGELPTGMAVTALVLAILALFCFGPLTGVLALILGIIAIVRAGEVPPRAGGKGMAIAAVVVSGLGILSSIITIPLIIGILLPALGAARNSAQQLQGSSNVRAIVQAIMTQSDSNSGRFPQTADGWQQNLIDTGFLAPGIFVSPRTDGLGDDYFFVPGGRSGFDATRMLVYEDPALDPDHTLIGFADGHVERVEQARAMQMLGRLTLPDGTPWAPHLSDPSATKGTAP